MPKTKTSRYDVAEHLRTPKEMAAYLEACLEESEGDASFIAKALGDIARAALTDQTIGDAELGRVVEYVSAASEQARSDVDVGVYPERLRLAVAAPEQ